jgi:thioredoxin 1
LSHPVGPKNGHFSGPYLLPSSLAELERDLIRERTQEGLAAARARGRNGVDGILKKMGRVLGRMAHVVTASSLLHLSIANEGRSKHGRGQQLRTPTTHAPAIYRIRVRGGDRRETETGDRACKRKPTASQKIADWCGPCQGLAPHLRRVLYELEGDVVLANVEVDEGDNMKLAGHYRVRGFPTVILFHNGEGLGRFSGSRASQWLREWLAEHLD